MLGNIGLSLSMQYVAVHLRLGGMIGEETAVERESDNPYLDEDQGLCIQ